MKFSLKEKSIQLPENPEYLVEPPIVKKYL